MSRRVECLLNKGQLFGGEGALQIWERRFKALGIFPLQKTLKAPGLSCLETGEKMNHNNLPGFGNLKFNLL